MPQRAGYERVDTKNEGPMPPMSKVRAGRCPTQQVSHERVGARKERANALDERVDGDTPLAQSLLTMTEQCLKGAKRQRE